MVFLMIRCRSGRVRMGGIMLQLPNYALTETLYEGFETRIQRAVHVPSGQRLVVKLPVAAPPSLRIVGRLLHEYQVLSKLAKVPGVARPWAIEQQGGSAALVLKDAGLPSLDRVLSERRRLPLAAALRLGLGLCRILEEVHAAGIMHKDIKPQNVTSVENRRVPVPNTLLSRGAC